MYADQCRCESIPLQDICIQRQTTDTVSLDTYKSILRVPCSQHRMAHTDTTGHCAVLWCAASSCEVLYNVLLLYCVLCCDVLYCAAMYCCVVSYVMLCCAMLLLLAWSYWNANDIDRCIPVRMGGTLECAHELDLHQFHAWYRRPQFFPDQVHIVLARSDRTGQFVVHSFLQLQHLCCIAIPYDH